MPQARGGDALALANLAVIAHGSLAEDAYDPEAHPDLERLDFHTMIVLLAAERFRPDTLPVLRAALGDTSYMLDLLVNGLDVVRPAFAFSEEAFTEHADQQLVGRPFLDLGPRRTITWPVHGLRGRRQRGRDRRAGDGLIYLGPVGQCAGLPMLSPALGGPGHSNPAASSASQRSRPSLTIFASQRPSVPPPLKASGPAGCRCARETGDCDRQRTCAARLLDHARVSWWAGIIAE